MRPPLPNGLLDEYRQQTWISPTSPDATLNALLDWLEEHPADAAALLPATVRFIKSRPDL